MLWPQKISAFELLCNFVPNLSAVCNVLKHDSAQENPVDFWGTQLQNVLNANEIQKGLFVFGQSVLIWPDDSGYIGSAIVTELNEHFVEVCLEEKTKSSVYHITKPAPLNQCLQLLRPHVHRTLSYDEAAENDDVHLKANVSTAVNPS